MFYCWIHTYLGLVFRFQFLREVCDFPPYFLASARSRSHPVFGLFPGFACALGVKCRRLPYPLSSVILQNREQGWEVQWQHTAWQRRRRLQECFVGTESTPVFFCFFLTKGGCSWGTVSLLQWSLSAPLDACARMWSRWISRWAQCRFDFPASLLSVCEGQPIRVIGFQWTSLGGKCFALTFAVRPSFWFCYKLRATLSRSSKKKAFIQHSLS